MFSLRWLKPNSIDFWHSFTSFCFRSARSVLCFRSPKCRGFQPRILLGIRHWMSFFVGHCSIQTSDFTWKCSDSRRWRKIDGSFDGTIDYETTIDNSSQRFMFTEIKSLIAQCISVDPLLRLALRRCTWFIYFFQIIMNSWKVLKGITRAKIAHIHQKYSFYEV